MKAYVLNGIGDLQYQPLPRPELQFGRCLVQVKAAGICNSCKPVTIPCKKPASL